MLNVSEAVKQAYINVNAKTEIFLTVTTTDGVVHEYNPRNILSGSVSIVESLCSSETFDISRVEKNELTFTLFNISEGISGLQGGNVVAKQRVYTDASDETVYTDIPLGTYTIAEAMNDGDYLYKCTAYEATTVKLDNLIDEWWKNLTFPITLRNLAISMFQYLGCAYDIPATFTNSNYSIETLNADFEGTTGAEILGYIQEIVGGFFKADRQGVIKLKVPTPVSSGLYPHIGLYPREGLYPRKSNRAFGDDTTAGTGDWDYPQIVGDLQLGDYDVKSVTKVQIRGTEDDIGIIAGSGTNTYVIQGNPLLFNLTAEDGATIAQNILDQVGQIAYKPFSGKFMSQPYVEVGDIAKIETYAGKEGDSPIFQRTLSGARLAFDNFQSLGLEYREQVSSVNRKLTTINQRTHEIKNTVDEMSSTVANVEQRVTTNETNITQNANAITLQATRSGVFNLLVNSDFSDQTERTRGWTINRVSTEYVYDELFMGESTDILGIENGNCLKVVPIGSGSCSIYQEINYTGTISERIRGEVSYRVINADGATIQPFLQIYSGDTSVIYIFVGSRFTADGEIHNMRWSVSDTYMDALDGVDVTRIQYGVYVLNGTTSAQFEINHLLLTFSESVLPFYAWTNYASKDLISQINISPSGVKIQGEKVDIWGVTTIHNSDGSGETVLTGSTIRSAIIETGTLKGEDSALTFDMSTSTEEYKIEMKPATFSVYDPSAGTTSIKRGLEFTDNGGGGAVGISASVFNMISSNYILTVNDGGIYLWRYDGTSTSRSYEIVMQATTSSTHQGVRYFGNDYFRIYMDESSFSLNYARTGSQFLRMTSSGITGINHASSAFWSINGSGYSGTVVWGAFKDTSGNTRYIPCLQV